MVFSCKIACKLESHLLNGEELCAQHIEALVFCANFSISKDLFCARLA